MVKYLYFDLYLLSKYRTQLMGIAAIMIVLVHSVDYGVEMPSLLRVVCSYGWLGVDIFLFLSGIGCCYSLSKNVSIKEWYKKRFIRIVTPYALMQVPFWIYKLIVGEFNLIDNLFVFSTIAFWGQHMGAWYIALTLPLYIFTPIFYLVIDKGHSFIAVSFLVLFILVICHVGISDNVEVVEYEILKNLQWAFRRVPSFIIGMSIATYVKNHKKVNVVPFVIIPLCLYIGVHQLIDKNIFMGWCLIFPILLFCIFILEEVYEQNPFQKFVSWMGLVSLESYLANIYLCGLVRDRADKIGYSLMLEGKYLEYFLIIVLGIFLSVIVHQISMSLIQGNISNNINPFSKTHIPV